MVRRLNPLHCGAVVASKGGSPRAPRRREVSIPFIAGQWSLHEARPGKDKRVFASQSPSLRGSGRFGMRIGAWRRAPRVSQSPSLRGSGRFSLLKRLRNVVAEGLNPLHCGAVVASTPPPTRRRAPRSSQSPSLRGSGRFPFAIQPRLPKAGSQSPSLRGSGRFLQRRRTTQLQIFSLNPLHCGAVVASGSRAHRSRRARKGLNPLHCGAVVASAPRRTAGGQGGQVSIPFIAGQWSLPPRTTPLSFCGVRLRKRRLPCDHIICTRLPF